MAIFTSRGHQTLKVQEYHAAVAALQPDVAIAPADLTYSSATVQSKRASRMVDRTNAWIQAWCADADADADADAEGDDRLQKMATFAPVLPIDYVLQREYLERLSADYAPAGAVGGLALYDVALLPDVAAQAGLALLPRLSLDAPAGPHEMLRHVALGVDVFVLPFVNDASEGGVALAFSFPAEPDAEAEAFGPRLRPLGIDMADPAHRASFVPIQPGCACYACRHHHRAYVHHLLRAREMLGWTLLQLHNHFAAGAFFAGVRAALSDGESFETARRRFAAAYEPELPAGTAERPRARGYHFKSEPGSEKRDKPTWNGNLETHV